MEKFRLMVNVLFAVTMGILGLFIGLLILRITYAAYKIYRDEKVKSKELQKL